MAFSMLKKNASPIAFDFGASSVKLLQATVGNDPTMTAAGELSIPDSIRDDADARVDYFNQELPKLLKAGRFRGKVATLAVPASQTHIQHMHLMSVPGVSIDDQIKTNLQTQMGCDPSGIVVRSVEVAPVHRDGQNMIETICFAITRETVMNHIDVMRRCKLDVNGIHVDAMAIVRVFDYINRRDGDADLSTLYVDIGWGGTRASVAHGKDIVFSRSIPLGGRQFDEHLAGQLHCDIATARLHRLSMDEVKARKIDPMKQSSGSSILDVAARSSEVAVADQRAIDSTAPSMATKVTPATNTDIDLAEPLDEIADELSMCLRYHRGLFIDRRIDRVIFLGGECRQLWICQHLVGRLQLPSQLGDPLVRLNRPSNLETPGVTFDGAVQPGWAVACGLVTDPQNA